MLPPESAPAPRGANALLAVSLAATVAVAGFAFIGSFRAMADYAQNLGLATGKWSWTFPAVIDGTVIVSAFVTIARGLRHAGGWHSTAVNLLAVTVSVVVNVAHAPDGNPEAQALAAVFPVFLAACAHLVFAEVRDLLHAPARTAAAGQSAAGRLAQLAARRLELALDPPSDATPTSPFTRADAVTDRRSDAATAPHTSDLSRGRPDAEADMQQREADTVNAGDPVAGLVAAHLAAGGQAGDAALTAAVAVALDVTDRTARRRLQPYRDPAPLALLADAGGVTR